MWRKADPTSPHTSSESLTPAVSSSQPPVVAAPAIASNATASVSRGIRIKGEMTGQGDLVFDGQFEGQIQMPESSLTVGPNAHIKADIEAHEIVVHGEVVGALKGGRVQISSTGRVTGEMETRGIVVEDGAVLRSRVRVRQDDEPAQLSLPAVAAVPRAKEAVAAAGGAPGKEAER